MWIVSRLSITSLLMVCSHARYHRRSHFLVADDVLRARLKTVGVSEYRCEMEAAAGREQGTEWRIVDVGGSRSQVGATILEILWSKEPFTLERWGVSVSAQHVHS